MKREDVYKLIDSEREYQINKWNTPSNDPHLQVFDDSKWALNDWIIFIERYIQEAKSRTGYPESQKNSIRKIAALAVAALEYNGGNPRY